MTDVNGNWIPHDQEDGAKTPTRVETMGNSVDSPTASENELARIVRWLRGAGYLGAANALAELHVHSCAMRKVKPLVFVVGDDW